MVGDYSEECLLHINNTPSDTDLGKGGCHWLALPSPLGLVVAMQRGSGITTKAPCIVREAAILDNQTYDCTWQSCPLPPLGILDYMKLTKPYIYPHKNPHPLNGTLTSTQKPQHAHARASAPLRCVEVRYG